MCVHARTDTQTHLWLGVTGNHDIEANGSEKNIGKLKTKLED